MIFSSQVLYVALKGRHPSRLSSIPSLIQADTLCCAARMQSGGTPTSESVSQAHARSYLIHLKFDGLGFREREVAYDFKATIYDFAKKINRQEAAIEAVKMREEAELSEEAAEENVDLALKGPIKINLANSKHRAPKPDEDIKRVMPARIAPPPADLPTCDPETGVLGSQEAGEDDFGDFESAPP